MMVAGIALQTLTFKYLDAAAKEAANSKINIMLCTGFNFHSLICTGFPIESQLLGFRVGLALANTYFWARNIQILQPASSS